MTARRRPAPPRPEAGADLRARWRYLERKAAPVLSPPALAAVAVLGASLLFAGVLQFGTTLLSDAPWLGMAFSAWHAGLAIVAIALIALRGRWARPQIGAAAVLALVLVLSIGAWGAQIQHRRGQAGNPYYALPHQALAYPEGSERVTLQTSDGVRIEATLLGAGKTRAIVLVPSWRTDRHAFSIVTLAGWLSNDFDVLVIDPRGQGGSGGAKRPDVPERLDVIAAAAYMRESGHRMVGVLAELDGAQAAVSAAAMRQGVDSLALVAPARTWGGSLGQHDRLWDPRRLGGRLYWRVVAGLRLAPGPEGPPLATAIADVAPTPLLLLGHRTPVGTEVDALHHAAREPRSLMVIPGEQKPASWVQFAGYYQMVREWFSLTLSTGR